MGIFCRHLIFADENKIAKLKCSQNGFRGFTHKEVITNSTVKVKVPISKNDRESA